MEKEKLRSSPCQHPKLTAAVISGFIFHLIVTCTLSYGWVIQSQTNRELRNEIELIKQACVDRPIYNLEKSDADAVESDKREVISTGQVDLSSLLKGQQGPIGPPGTPGKDGSNGRDGLPGRDGKDFASLSLLREVVNVTVAKEWRQFTSKLPTYGGSTFIRWGKRSCPETSTLIYRGQMAGSDLRSSGGGANFQCLPDDPEYSSTKIEATASSLRLVQYVETPNLVHHRVPCVACEAEQRLTMIMIPAKTRCPSSDWNLDYRGHLMTELETNEGEPDNFTAADIRGPRSFVCVDEHAESLTSKPVDSWIGGVLHAVRAGCTGGGALMNCPPYKSDNSALSCVVCSK